MKITIVTVVYNSEDLVERTILSVLQQKYKDFEYIVIDGASTDKTIEIINQYKDQITHFVSEVDDGIYFAMNKAIELSSGDWINFLNAGDIFTDMNVLSSIAKELDENYSFVYGDRYRVDEYNTKKYEKAGSLNDTLYQEVVFHQALFTKSELLKKLKYNTCYKLAADYEFVVKNWCNEKKFKYVGFPICDFLEGGRSRQQYLKAQIEAIKIIFDYQPDKSKWKKNIYFEHFISSNIGYILNKNLQAIKRKYSDFKLLPITKNKSLYISSNIEAIEVSKLLKVVNDPLSFIDREIDNSHDKIINQDILLEKLDVLSKISFFSNPLQKYRAYKNILKEFNQIKRDTKQYAETSKTPIFSIVTVTFNAEEYLSETIKSVINQKNSDFEYIIVDGASIDNTVKIIEENSEHVDFWLSEPDNGLYDAMNKGINYANGEYILFMNAGDTFANDNILHEVQHKINLNIDDIVYGDRYYLYSDGRKELQKAKSIDTVFERMPFGHQSCFIKRELLQARLFNETYKYAADYDMIVDFYLKKKKFKHLDIPICNFLHGGESESGIRPYLEVMKILLDNCKDKQLIKKSLYFKAFKNNVHSLLEI